MTAISDVELDLIEEQAADYGLELYPIEGVALDALIKRLRTSEDFIDKLEQRNAALQREMDTRTRWHNFVMVGLLLVVVVVGLTGCGHGCSQTEFLTNSLCR